MSVFSLDVVEDNPVTPDAVDKLCAELGVKLKQDEREDYRRLLAVFHDTSEQLMSTPDYVPQVDLSRFSREDVRFPDAGENTHGAWAWRCSIRDEHSRGNTLLDGRTIAIKDMINVKDVPMLMGTTFVKNTDATLVTGILESGGHIVGKSVCENMCHSATSHSATTGVVENPFAKRYSSGGSSSGSGVLVALGEVDMAIGADQGGSIRVPAANCGIV